MRLRLSITLDVTRDRDQAEGREAEPVREAQPMRETVLDAYVEHAPEQRPPAFGFAPRVTEEDRG